MTMYNCTIGKSRSGDWQGEYIIQRIRRRLTTVVLSLTVVALGGCSVLREATPAETAAVRAAVRDYERDKDRSAYLLDIAEVYLADGKARALYSISAGGTTYEYAPIAVALERRHGAWAVTGETVDCPRWWRKLKDVYGIR